MMRYFILSTLILAAFTGVGQPLSLAECQEAALAQSPLQQQKKLIAMQTNLKNENLGTNFLPQFGLNGQLTWQSEVITFPTFGPGIEFPQIPQTQYTVGLNINQLIYDGGAVRKGKALNAIGQQVQTQQIEVEVNKVKETVNQLYFSILILDKNEEVLNETLEELNARLKIVQAGVKNGVMLKSNQDEFQKQILSLEQRIDQIQGDKRALRQMLADWIGAEDGEALELSLPDEVAEKSVSILPENRPEYALFNLQKQQLEASKDASKVKLMPKVSAFANGGIGQPNPLNFIDVDPSPFVRAGVMVAWNPWDWKSSHRDREIMTMKQEMIDNQRRQFDQVMSISQRQDQEKITSLENLIQKDEQIIELHEAIIKQASSQLENGVITATDYLTKVNDQTQTQLNLEIHKIQLIQAKANILTRAGSSIK
jgi:outer membrane protein TolC